MSNTISIHGNTAERMFTYTENGVYNEFTAPVDAKVISA